MQNETNKLQMKEKDKTLEKELNKMEISNLADKEVQIIVINMFVIGKKNGWTQNFNKQKKKTPQNWRI